ncbi:hypothetical protein DL89DRAFT_269858 [Linderina pennispora]|uniref:Uncharacterized protein n=1 Tax=Linderina pennispora TaxID=61395 RepID=A0A1Y1W0P0_9FUNG|nr:uncharacterized protein DL89DRAFT_269858 [Linderina pennispora]ORX66806.1 hypothetical protein DL89DRAFT_269858 [Linderina pennispora]
MGKVLLAGAAVAAAGFAAKKHFDKKKREEKLEQQEEIGQGSYNYQYGGAQPPQGGYGATPTPGGKPHGNPNDPYSY